MKRSFALLLPFVLVACQDRPDPLVGPSDVLLNSASSRAPADPFVAGRLLARFQPGAAASQIAAAHGASIERELVLGIQMLKVPVGQELQVADALSRNPGVVYAEPDYIYTFGDPCGSSTNPCVAPSDGYFGYKWDLHNDGTLNNSTGTFVANTGKVDADIDWLEAYNHLGSGFNGSAVAAILDSGVRRTHVDLAGKVIGEWDFFANDGDAADDYGHGTHVAGIVAAHGNNGDNTGKNVIGVAWNSNVKLIVAKVCGYSGTGPFKSYGCPSSGTATAIKWAADNGANVINLSLGGSTGSSAQQDALKYALSKNVLAFCATGNDNGKVSYPAAFPECVAVAATNWSDGRASYSNFGPETEISAPGGDSEDPNGYSYILSSHYNSDTDYVFMAGTSMATPQATGLAALLYALKMTSASDVRALIKNTADDLGPAGRDDAFGAGRINVYRAVTSVGSGSTSNTPPSASFTHSCSELTCTFTDGSSDSDGNVTAWKWEFGDGGTSTTQHPTYSYATGGTYTVKLTVTDNSGAISSTSKDVTVTAPSSAGISLSATGYKVKGMQKVDLSWSGATSTNVDVYRNNSNIVTTPNDEAHTDSINQKGGGSYTYKLCEAGTTTCSNSVTVTF